MNAVSAQNASTNTKVSLAELAFVFLKLGTTAFGGPAAHIAMMQNEFVRKRRWISDTEFLDRIAAASLIPGPTSTEVAIFIGYSMRGWAGLILAGCCFIIPAAVLVGLMAAAYVRFESLPQVSGILYGIKPAVIAVILQALWGLGRTAAKTTLLIALGLISAFLSFAGVAPVVVLAATGLASAVGFFLKTRKSLPLVSTPLTKSSALLLWAAAAAASAPISLIRLFLSFLKIGSVVFGSGYVLLAFLRAEFVDHLHWLTEKQLIDAVAVGQFTPGPVFTTATFIGYLVAGARGSVLATTAIFLPGFFFVALSGPLLPGIRRSPLAAAVLDGVVIASLALMAVVAWQLGRAAIVDWLAFTILIVSSALLLRFRINSAWVIVGAAFVGWLTH